MKTSEWSWVAITYRRCGLEEKCRSAMRLCVPGCDTQRQWAASPSRRRARILWRSNAVGALETNQEIWGETKEKGNVDECVCTSWSFNRPRQAKSVCLGSSGYPSFGYTTGSHSVISIIAAMKYRTVTAETAVSSFITHVTVHFCNVTMLLWRNNSTRTLLDLYLQKRCSLPPRAEFFEGNLNWPWWNSR